MIKIQIIKRKQNGINERAPSVEFRVGPDPIGPARCINCLQPFKEGELWKRMTSRLDTEFGAYSIGIHDRCSETLESQAAKAKSFEQGKQQIGNDASPYSTEP